MQLTLLPQACGKCGKKYRETGYWRDGDYCPKCSMEEREKETARRAQLAEQASAIAAKYSLDLDKYSEYLPEGLRQELNPKNAGRKETKWDPGYCALLVARAAEGKTESEFAAEIGISQGLIKGWTERHPRFKQARETAGELREAWLERTFRDAMLGKVKAVPALLLRYMAVKLGWREKGDAPPAGAGGEIPVMVVVKRDAGFPSETREPTAEQAAGEGAGV